METFSVLLALCAGNSPVTGNFAAQRPVTRSFDVFFDLRLNKRLSKQPWGWWLRRHRGHYDVNVMTLVYMVPQTNEWQKLTIFLYSKGFAEEQSTSEQFVYRCRLRNIARIKYDKYMLTGTWYGNFVVWLCLATRLTFWKSHRTSTGQENLNINIIIFDWDSYKVKNCLL